VCEVIGADACAAFLVDPTDGYLVLRETRGLNRTCVDQIRIGPEEGVIGLVRERRAPVSLAKAATHPRFLSFPESGEQRFQGFLGVPMVHRGEALGVLSVWRGEDGTFDQAEEAFLVTLSAQLAGALAPSLERWTGRFRAEGREHAGYLQGVAGASGVAVGEGVVPSPLANLEAVLDRSARDPALEEAAFRAAVAAVQAELVASGERMHGLLPSESHALFEVYSMLVGDKSLSERVLIGIRGGLSAAAALLDAIAEVAGRFEAMANERLAARAEDLRAVGRRLLLELSADADSRREFPERTVLVGDEVSLARIADVPRERLAGIVCRKGSVLSHTVVIARALGIPAVMGIEDLSIERLAGKILVVDGYEGRVLPEPPPAVIRVFERLVHEERLLGRELEALNDLPAETSDGVRIALHVNTGLLSDIQPGLAVQPDGVGLYRSEFPFMLRETFPSEAEQCAVYRQMLEAFAPRPVVMRTLDIGGDKPLGYFPVDEANGLLGWRGVRVSLQQPEIFLVQLRAMLRANAELGNLRILLPMVSTANEVKGARELLGHAMRGLREDGLGVRPVELGVMLEVPSALFSLDVLSEEADFFSLGTNDLTQYLLAVDRGNPRVAALYDHLEPAVLRAVQHAVLRLERLGKPVSLCGELAGDPAGALLLLGMGLEALSMAAACVPAVRWVVRSFSRARAGRILERALRLRDAGSVRTLVHGELEGAGLGGLVRAGR